MKRLKIIKNMELRNNNSENPISFRDKKLQDKKKTLLKIYNYYFSKNKIKEKLISQKISLMKKDLRQKQKEEKNIFKYNFYKRYPPEKNFENRINDYLREKIKSRTKNDISEEEEKRIVEMKNELLNKQHEEYIKNMGIAYEKAFSKLREKFRKEKYEQNFEIKRIVLNHRLEQIYKKDDYYQKRNKSKGINISQDNISFSNRSENNSNNTINNKLCSKIFKFGTKGSLYKTILI